MKLTQQEWEKLKEEFGTHAHKRVQYVEKGDLGQTVYYSHNNNDVDNFLLARDYELRPLSELFVHDVQVYGDDAYLMWEWEIDGYCVGLVSKQMLDWSGERAKLVKRKESARLPFDLKRAQNGEEIQLKSGKELLDCIFLRQQANGFSIADIQIGNRKSYARFSELFMKYPPKASL